MEADGVKVKAASVKQEVRRELLPRRGQLLQGRLDGIGVGTGLAELTELYGRARQ